MIIFVMTHRIQNTRCSELKMLLERLGQHASADCQVPSGAAHEIATRRHAALMEAAANGDLGVWSVLLNGRADVDVRAACGSILLILAAATGQTAMMTLPLENGADIAAGDRTATTALIRRQAFRSLAPRHRASVVRDLLRHLMKITRSASRREALPYCQALLIASCTDCGMALDWTPVPLVDVLGA